MEERRDGDPISAGMSQTPKLGIAMAWAARPTVLLEVLSHVLIPLSGDPISAGNMLLEQPSKL